MPRRTRPEAPLSEYRDVYRSVRPIRAATMFPGSDDWEAVVLRLVEGPCRTWGGAAGAIFPILKDGTVNKSFWPLLHAHDPDELAVYQLSPRRILMSDSAAFDSWLDGEPQRWSSQTGMTVEEAKQTLSGPLMPR